MLDPDVMADIEGDASYLLRRAGLDEDVPGDLRRLCVALTKAPPSSARMALEGHTAIVLGEQRVFLRAGLAPARAKWVLGHELGHVWYRERGYDGEDLEERCDALGAALVAPRRAYLAARRAVGGKLAQVAKALGITESVTLLRDGEVTGAPSALVRVRGPIVRGEPFVWPVTLDLPHAKATRHPGVRRVRIGDEPGRMGLAARAPEAALPDRCPRACSSRILAPAAALRDDRRSMANELYYGDNLDVLRDPDCIAPGSVDLIYLDPPFNSQRNYNAIWKDAEGVEAEASSRAFEDTWRWDAKAEATYQELVGNRRKRAVSARVSSTMELLHQALGDSDRNLLAYLVMMAVRLVELRRVLKPTGSLYLHCDPTASHYLKVLLDAVFGSASFLNEIVWQRTNARSAADRWPRVHDMLHAIDRTRTERQDDGHV